MSYRLKGTHASLLFIITKTKTRAPNVTKFARPFFLRPSIVIIGFTSAKLSERTLLVQFWPF